LQELEISSKWTPDSQDCIGYEDSRKFNIELINSKKIKMNTYTVSYDLRNQRNYDSLYEAIKACWSAWRLLESFWVLVSEHSATQIFDHLQQFIDSDDWLIVLKSWWEAKWVNVNLSTEWLKNNL
jgi:hypothetical protein